MCYNKIMNQRKLPIGIQDFEYLRKNNYVYIDKTEFVFNLAHNGKPYFLSRPRRFGKSLFLSTLEAYFLGKKELFNGLKIEELEAQQPDSWTVYPVLKFDFNGQNYSLKNSLNDIIEVHIKKWEEEYGCHEEINSLSLRFAKVIETAYKKTGKEVVVLVDEYDKSLLETMTIDSKMVEENRAIFKGLFGQLKRLDAYIKFVFFTGVTKFSKVSIFSDLNQLKDISLDWNYDAICGITQTELETNFQPEIQAMSERNNISKEECLLKLKRMYDGYHFCMNCPDIYNPFSLLNSFGEKRLGYYWFGTGTPTFLIQKLRAIDFDPKKFIETVKISEQEINDYRPENPDPIPLFYQSGYLTIKSWNEKQLSYRLGFPNDEVKYGFLTALAPSYLKVEDKPAPFNIDILDDAVEEGDTDGIRDWFRALFALLPYPTSGDLDSVTEQSFQNVIYISMIVLGKYCRTEVHSSKGRADCIVETQDFVYIFEFKRDGSAKDALLQIEEKEYSVPYAVDKRKIFKIGCNFSSIEKNIVEWEVS